MKESSVLYIIRESVCQHCSEKFPLVFIEKEHGRYICKSCNKISDNDEEVKQHLETHHRACCKRCQLLLVAKANKGTIAGVVVGAAAAPLMLPVVGFTAGGVAAGSVAAATQSAVYGAYTCGVFSILQSAGTGAAGAVATVAVGGGCSGGLIGKVVGHFPFVNRRGKEDEEKETAQCKQSSDGKKNVK